jgi:hypothetical protein
LEESAECVGLPLEVVSITNTAAADLYDANLVLVRPDLMIAWRSDNLPDQLPDLLNQVRGAYQ